MSTNIRDVIDLPYPYFLYNLVYGEYDALEISKEDYEKIKARKDILRAAKSIEEKYDVLLESYIEFEQHVASICIQTMVRGHHDYTDVYETLRDLNARISVFLSIAKMYTDHLFSDAGTLKIDDLNFSGLVASEFEKHRKDKHFVLAEVLRNYSQHVGVPVGNTEIVGQHSKNHKNTGGLFYALKIWAPRDDLARVRAVRRDVLSMFEEDAIDLKHTIGRYMSGLSSIHHVVRKYLDPVISDCRDCIESWEKIYRNKNGSDSVHALTAIQVKNNTIKEEIQLNLEWEGIRQRLVSRNKGIKNYSNSYITTMSATMLGKEMSGSL